MRVKLQRLTRGPGRRKLFIAIWIAIFVVATVLIYKYKSYRMHNLMISNLRKRMIHYCNPPGPVLGNEPLVPMEYAQFTLKQVQVVVRHGDRSSVATSFKTVNPYHFNCEIKSENPSDAKKLQLLKKMQKYFKKIRLRNDGKHITEDFLLLERVICKAGQLTSKGYLQHLYLGEHIFYAYGKRLGISIASAEEEEILVYTTPIERTQQSAAAFLTGMLQTVYKNAESTENFPPVKIRVSPDKLGIFQEDENGDIQPCPRLHQVMKENRQSWKYKRGLQAIEPLMETFSYLFNITRSKLPPITWVGDLIVAHQCHHHPPVCGPNGCVDDSLKADTWRASDWAFSSNFTPPALILSHPVLSKIFQRMVVDVSGEQHTKFVLFAAHDTTVIPILVNLGIFSNQWPGYTSRIVFELWEAGGLLGTKLVGDDLEKHFVRVLYNGIDYTTKIRMCKGSLKFGKLCSLKSFLKALEAGMESMGEKYADLCKM